jgi:hypothetical protein
MYNIRRDINNKNKVWTTWKVIKKETSKIQRVHNILQIQIEDRQITNTKEIANAFNEHFITTAEKLITNTLDKKEAVKVLDKCKNNNILKIKLIPTTEIEIKSIITSFKAKNSTGYEGISPRILKHCMNAISKPIGHI